MQRESIDRGEWPSGVELASARSEWIEGCGNLCRRHSGLGACSPTEYGTLATLTTIAA